MSELMFYQCLVKCFNQDENCKKCPLYGKGLKENNECKRILMNEISKRKTEALLKEEEE